MLLLQQPQHEMLHYKKIKGRYPKGIYLKGNPTQAEMMMMNEKNEETIVWNVV